ncbi:MAG: HRDC domain-containing protein [Candidatus Thermoplasmatota archaeon]
MANSRKLLGRCVAGKELKTRSWIRPVSNLETGELPISQITYKDGSAPEVLDIIRIPIHKWAGKCHQPENMLVRKERWVKIGKFPFEKIDELCDSPATLWLNQSFPNDRVPGDYLEKNKIANSLYFIKPESIKIIREDTTYKAGRIIKKRTNALFVYNGTGYLVRVTDPQIEREYNRMDVGTYELPVGPKYLCVSLSEPLEGICYKLVAAIIQKTNKDNETKSIQMIAPEKPEHYTPKLQMKEFYITIEEPIELHSDTVWALWYMAKDSLENEEINQFMDIFKLLSRIRTTEGNMKLTRILASLTKMYEAHLKDVQSQILGWVKDVSPEHQEKHLKNLDREADGDYSTDVPPLYQKLKKWRDKPEINLIGIEKEVYEALRKWRNTIAEMEGVPPYVIAHNAWLQEMAKSRCKTKEDLLQVKGFGKKRVEKYGGDILKVVKSTLGDDDER